FDDEDEAIKWADTTEYGLASYIFTGDDERAARVMAQLNFGHCGYNTGTGPTPEAPFGGMKQSGIGREGGLEGLMEYVELQTVPRGFCLFFTSHRRPASGHGAGRFICAHAPRTRQHHRHQSAGYTRLPSARQRANGVSACARAGCSPMMSYTCQPATSTASATGRLWQRQGTSSAHLIAVRYAGAASVNCSRPCRNAAVCM